MNYYHAFYSLSQLLWSIFQKSTPSMGTSFSVLFFFFFFTLKKLSMEGVDENCTSHFCIKTEKNSHAFIIVHEDYESGGSHCQ